ncbi:MAG: P-II family nitrogen regulator [Spirochaetales bacterium]|nr:P-II family nitrogen regulator [Spirochaetales bacterium]
MNETQYELLTVIVNKGFASDAMSAARKAGATGGTILNARGTAREGDEKFFGMDIVPEKELLMILTKTENEAAIREAIRALPCLSTPGSGIAFTCPADNFTLLGKK